MNNKTQEENIFICKHCGKETVRIRAKGMACMDCGKVYNDKGEFKAKLYNNLISRKEALDLIK